MTELSTLQHLLEIQEFIGKPNPQDLQDHYKQFAENYYQTLNFTESIALALDTEDEDLIYKYGHNIRRHSLLGPWIKRAEAYQSEVAKRDLGLLPQVDLHSVVSQMPIDMLNSKQRRFVMSYAGDVKAAMAEAGYKYSQTQRVRLLSDPVIAACIKELDTRLEVALVASKLECQKFLTNVMHDETQHMTHRINATKLLMQSKGIFAEVKRDVNMTNMQININTNLDDPKEIQTIEMKQ